MALNFDIMEHIGEDVNARRNHSKVIQGINSMFAEYLEGRHLFASALDYLVEFDGSTDLIARGFGGGSGECYDQVMSSIYDQATIDDLAKDDPSTARD